MAKRKYKKKFGFNHVTLIKIKGQNYTCQKKFPMTIDYAKNNFDGPIKRQLENTVAEAADAV